MKNALSGENCAIDYINSALRGLSSVISIDNEYEAMFDRLKSAADELDDISSLAESFLENIDIDAESADMIEERLDKIKTLKRKYGQSEKEIFAFLDNAESDYTKLIDFDAEYSRLCAEKERELNNLNGIYEKMSQIRKAAAEKLKGRISEELRQLGMKNATFEIAFLPLKEADGTRYSSNGGDMVEFLFSANLGEPVKTMSKIISGGEMSRFMLSLKTVISTYHSISTYIFDEIDAGISGKTAETVAEKFSQIAKNVQVIAISHLPQIVSFSDASFKISKYSTEEKTFTTIEKLDSNGKIEEIVRLVGGDMSSSSAVSHAKEMIDKAGLYKKSI